MLRSVLIRDDDSGFPLWADPSSSNVNLLVTIVHQLLFIMLLLPSHRQLQNFYLLTERPEVAAMAYVALQTSETSHFVRRGQSLARVKVKEQLVVVRMVEVRMAPEGFRLRAFKWINLWALGLVGDYSEAE